MRSMKPWYAAFGQQGHARAEQTYGHVHFSRPLMSLSLLASSSFRKSLVFCAKSLRWVRVSRWWATRSEATVSSCGTRVVRSMSVSAVSAVRWRVGASTYSSTRLSPSGTCSPLPCPRGCRRSWAHLGSFWPPCPRGFPWVRIGSDGAGWGD